jgi:hypothetical protein
VKASGEGAKPTLNSSPSVQAKLIHSVEASPRSTNVLVADIAFSRTAAGGSNQHRLAG